MLVRAATECELPVIERLYERVIAAMRGTPYDILWEMGVHPTHERLLDAARTGSLLVAVEAGGEASICGVLILDGNQAAGYRDIPWGIAAAPERVRVIHLLAVDPGARDRGVGRALMAGAIDAARAQGAQAVRLDVFDNNKPAYNLYKACGFADRGLYTLDVGDGFTHAANLMELDLRGDVR